MEQHDSVTGRGRWVDSTVDALEVSWCIVEEGEHCLCRRQRIIGVHAGMIVCQRCTELHGAACAWYHGDCVGIHPTRLEAREPPLNSSHFAYEAQQNNDTLHTNHYTIRTL